MNHEQEKLAGIILGLVNDEHVKSTLQLALQCARYHAGYESEHGIDNINFKTRHNLVNKILDGTINNALEPIEGLSEESELFTALFLYLNCLEQLGTLFGKKIFNGNNRSENGIYRALSTFKSVIDLSEEEKRAIQHLRNALAHNFGLVNYNERNIQSSRKYILDFQDYTDKILDLPITVWNGNWSDKSDDTSINVYVFPLMRLSEEILRTIIEIFRKGQLNFSIDDIEEIRSRFTIRH